MNKLKNFLSQQLPLGVMLASAFLLSVIIGFGIHLVFGWTGPSANPPTPNVNPPITTAGGQTIAGNLTLVGDLLKSGADGQLAASTDKVFRDTGDNWLRLNTAAGSGAYADFAAGNIYASSMLYVMGTSDLRGTITNAAADISINDNVSITGNLTVSGAITGGGAGIPSGLIAIFDTACPAGWTRVAAWDNRFIRGAAAYGATGGSDTHLHSVDPPATQTGSAVGNDWPLGTGPNQAPGDYHGHSVDITAFNSGSASNVPAYINVVFCRKN